MHFSAEIFVRALTSNLDTPYDPVELAAVRDDRTARIITATLADMIQSDPGWKAYAHIERFTSACALWHISDWNDSLYKQRKDIADKAVAALARVAAIAESDEQRQALGEYNRIAGEFRKKIAAICPTPEIEKVLIGKFLEAKRAHTLHTWCRGWNKQMNYEFFLWQELEQLSQVESLLKTSTVNATKPS